MAEQIIYWEEKVWGRRRHVHHEHVEVDILEVNQGFQSSIHRHPSSWNSFQVITGQLAIEIFNDSGTEVMYRLLLKPGESLTVEPKFYHRFQVIETGIVVETYWVTDGSILLLDRIERLNVGGPI